MRVEVPETRYVKSGEVSIAYQVVGEGPLDLVFVGGYVNHLELAWKIDVGVAVRAGMHTGECELANGKLAGIALHTGARVSAHAGPGEVLVSSTVKDLVAGSGIEFADRDVAELKGIPGEWRLFAVTQA